MVTRQLNFLAINTRGIKLFASKDVLHDKNENYIYARVN